MARYFSKIKQEPSWMSVSLWSRIGWKMAERPSTSLRPRRSSRPSWCWTTLWPSGPGSQSKSWEETDMRWKSWYLNLLLVAGLAFLLWRQAEVIPGTNYKILSDLVLQDRETGVIYTFENLEVRTAFVSGIEEDQAVLEKTLKREKWVRIWWIRSMVARRGR